jgi:uncharacterized 2Fe-2S/4Fe-4S cluster protein (DUF4445 family)
MADTARVIFHPMNRAVAVGHNSTVLDAIREAGIQVESICGGKGECNKCLVIFLRGSSTAGSPESVKGLSPDEVDRHYCRACQTRILGNCEFILPVESRIEAPKILRYHPARPPPCSPTVTKYLLRPQEESRYPRGHGSLRLEGYSGTRPHMSLEERNQLASARCLLTVTISTANGYPEVIHIEENDTREVNYGVAIDLGTTTVAGILVNLTDCTICAEASALNRQITYGEELLTRISYAKNSAGRTELQKAAAESINEVISRLLADAKIPASSINDLCLAGNTVMNYLLLGKETRTLELPDSAIPRSPVVTRAGSLKIASGPKAYLFCLPNVSRFVGGDAVGDSIISGMTESADLSIMIDLGTNGEVLLGNQDWLASVSCASGPAFEGAGITAGMRAMEGAIDHIAIDPADCSISWTTIGNKPPRGICGSGIIDAAAAMAAAGILDFTGKFVSTKPGVRYGYQGYEYVIVPGEKTATGRDICITNQDMTYLMDSKAAACGAVGVLLKKYRLSVQDIRHVYLAGAFGAYTDLRNIVRFGIIPDFTMAEFHAIGNGSLSGALFALISAEMRKKAVAAAEKMVYIDLLVDADFIEEYSAALYIPGKKEYFPR